MNQQNADVKRIDAYINSLDKVAAKKRKAAYLIVVPVFILVIAVSLILFAYAPQEPTQVNEQELGESSISIFSDLNYSQIRDHFIRNEGALEVEVPELKKIVSLHSEKEYWELLEELSVHFLNEDDLKLAEEESPSSTTPLLVDRTPHDSRSQAQKIQTPFTKRVIRRKASVKKEERIEANPVPADERIEETKVAESNAKITDPNPEAEVFEVKTVESTPTAKDAPSSTVVNSLEPTYIASASPQKSASIPTQPLVIASKNPAFPGGETDLTAYLNSKIKYPQPARDYHVEGTVYVQFVIQSDGTLTNHKVLKGIGYGCDEEALRIAQSMPRWSPGEQNGEAVPVWFTLPVTFDLLN